ncbi:MAG: HlyD family efflux transporter periplasmic adaptor subunit [Planctomycetales bacterium]|nr:HlyD family efflux transporter periplasmic adaptor subunit [Planctomycetales bacterium]
MQSDNSILHQRRILAPVSYSEALMPALRLARSSRLARRLAKFLLSALAATIVLMAFAPWQQSVTGSGSVVAYAPRERQQTIEAPIKGRVVRWGEGLVENAYVAKGEFLVEIQDLDSSYQGRLDDQLRNSQQQVFAANEHLRASERALEAAKTIIESLEAQRLAYVRVKEETIAAQDAYVEMAEKKVQAEKQQLVEYQAAIPQLQAEYDRTKMLHAEGNISLQKLQEVERKLAEGQAKVSRASAYVSAAEAELIGKTRERHAKADKAQIDIDYATATLQKANGDVSKAESDIAKSQQELNKAEKDLLESQTKVARQATQVVTAPIDGFVWQIKPNFGGGILKEGDALCTIVPDTQERAVQIWVKGNDVPLVKTGRHVRLQFEGWPALQFSGWPSIAVGTFGGQVASVDATDDGTGKFRVLIRPDSGDRPWPEDRYLRQGVRANGWVLLDRVPLWFETWRRLNGFPPVVSKDQVGGDASKSKPPKLPK